MNEVMRRVVVEPDGVRIISATKPTVGPHDVGVEMVISGVCGSDIHAAAGHHPFLKPPYFPGHEVVGTVHAVGDAVTSVTVGDKVTVEPTLPCWDCKMCRTERSNICENLRFFGCGYEQGGMADYFTVPANRAHVLPTEMSALDAALIEPLATPVHAERLSGGVRDKTVVIIGAGTIGLLMLAAVRHAGARRIVMTDMLQSKRERALRLGADMVVDAASGQVVADVRDSLGESADVVFDCVAVQPTLDQAVAFAAKGGTVVIVGVPPKPVVIPVADLQEYQIRLQGSATYTALDYERAIAIIESGGASAEDLITARYPLDQAADAFAASASGEHVKVVVTRTSVDAS